MQRNTEERKKMLKERRERQRNRRADIDSQLRFFSKNSIPAYRKN